MFSTKNLKFQISGQVLTIRFMHSPAIDLLKMHRQLKKLICFSIKSSVNCQKFCLRENTEG